MKKKKVIEPRDVCKERNIVTTWNGIDVKIKTYLALNEMLEFVHNVVDGCFDSENGSYHPENKDFFVRNMIVEEYTTFALPRDTKKRYEILYGSDIVSFVTSQIDSTQFNQMLDAIDDEVDHIAESNVSAITMQVMNVISGLSAIEDRLASIFGDVDDDTVSKIATAIVDGGFDENKLVRAFMDEKETRDTPNNVVPMALKDEE